MKKALNIAFVCSMALPLITCGGGSKPMGAPTTAAARDTTTAAAVDTTMADTAAAPKVGTEVANKGKPLVWFNHQPFSSATGQFDMTALNFNRGTYYVGLDANQGVELQGTMAKDYIEKNIGSIGHNGDGVIGYVPVISDTGRNNSITRTRSIYKALDTAVEKGGSINSDPVGTDADGAVTVVQDGPVEVGGKTYVVRELASQEMENSVGAAWDVATAGSVIDTRSSSLGDQINIVASDNDGTGMSMFNAWPKDNKVPTLGYDANSDTVVAIAEGYGSAISQCVGVQAYLAFRVLRNVLDGVDIDTGIGTADGADNVLNSGVYVYEVDERSYYTLNVAVTAENYTDLTGSIIVYTSISNQLDGASYATKSIWLNIYNSADNFLGSTYQSLFQKYNKLLNLKIDYIGGDGQTESNITNRLGNPSRYDAFAINMVKADSTASYTSLLEQ